jgi:hypothetical protein
MAMKRELETSFDSASARNRNTSAFYSGHYVIYDKLKQEQSANAFSLTKVKDKLMNQIKKIIKLRKK